MPETLRPDAYLICATPRTGSSLLCGLLQSTGVAGCPEAYFRRQNEQSWADRWKIGNNSDGTGAFTYDQFARAAVAAGSTANGIFGAKVMWGTMHEIVAKLATVYPQRFDLGLLEKAFGHTRFVYLQHDDIVAQAVSWLRAEQTNTWFVDHHGPSGRTGEPWFDFDGIHELVEAIEEHNAAWEAWFTSVGVRPHRLSYEELIGDLPAVTGNILEFLGLELPRDQQIAPRHHRQADALNAEWAIRYRAAIR